MSRLFRLIPLLFAACLLHPTQSTAGDLEFRDAVRGEIDLTGWDGEAPLQIRGEWTFFWNELLGPEEFLQRIQRGDFRPGYLTVGQSFSAFDPEQIKSNDGFGTFVLRLRGLPAVKDLGYKGLSAYSASLVYFFDAAGNGAEEPKGMAGRVGTRDTLMVPRMQDYTVQPLGAIHGQDYFFLIQVSNFHHRKGGLWLPPEIGRASVLQAAQEHDLQVSFFFIGMMAFIVFYNLSFFSRRFEDKGPLWLALTTTVLLVRSLSYAGSQFGFLGLDANASFEFRWKIFYMIPLVTIFFMHFVSSYFPAQLPSRIVRRFWFAVLPCLVFIAVTKVRTFSHFINPIAGLGFFMALYCIVAQFRAARAREKGAFISLLGTILVFIGSILDLLWSKGFTWLPTNCTGITITLFVIAQSQIVAVRFAAAFRKAEHLSRELQNEVAKQTRDIKSILRSIKQGIFTLVQPHRTVGSQYSNHLRDIVERDHIEGETLDRLLLDHSQISADEKSQIEAALIACIGEDSVAFEANEHCLVRELNFTPPGGASVKQLELEWTPIMAKDGSVEKVLVCVRDITELRELKQQANQRGEDLRIIHELINIAEDRFQRFVRTTSDYLEQSRESIRDRNRSHLESIKLLFINMHTIKGIARAFQLHAISEVSHEIEQYYSAIRRDEESWDPARLLADLDRFQSVLAQYQEAGRTKLGWDMDNKMLRLPRGKLLQGLETLQSLNRESWNPEDRKSLGDVETLLMEYCYPRLQDVIEDLCTGLPSLARNLEKVPPEIFITPSSVVLQEAGVDLTQSVVAHLLRNSMDHGIERPEVRLDKGKPSQGRISIQIQRHGPELQIDFMDDGAGLDLDHIRNLAIERNLLHPHEAPSDLELARLIFEDGLSTKGVVTDISGRGVGMSAIRKLLEEKGGHIELVICGDAYDRRHAPIALRLVLPQPLWRIAHDAQSLPKAMPQAG